MPNLTITSANIKIGSVVQLTSAGKAGETLTFMDVVYLKADDKRYWKAAANLTAVEAEAIGLVLLGNTVGLPVLILTGGSINPGAALVKGTRYVLSATAGRICPQADLVATNYLTDLGYASSTSLLELKIKATGVQL